MHKVEFLKNSMGTVVYINGIPFLINGTSLSEREPDGYMDVVTMEMTPLRFNTCNGEQSKWYTQIEQPVESDEIKKIIDNTTEKPKQPATKKAIKDATFGLYLTCANEPQFKEAYKKQFSELIKHYDTTNTNLETGLIALQTNVRTLELMRDTIVKDWLFNMDYTLSFEIKQITKKYTFGLFVTNIDKPEFTANMLSHLKEMVRHNTELADDDIRKNLETGLIMRCDSVSDLTRIKNDLILDWNMDYESTFEIRKIDGNS